ncbi:cation:proton antiporter [Pseudoroseicyclus aestuarii]|uniref:Sodium/proton antiporter (CPA1 family) n=1 Tax=Pseudoroseicyclus aestuarii TaxID=1795041 RepID=A0A318SX79_9RHOB|nr:cation:proton antiporter [Pseudoroseicyclus aestuarii]PYE85945.1 sodium/proton antiporter (CPA1 family) [Pseudoroseicyclus aestuarii]
MDIVIAVAILATFFLLIGLGEPLAAKLRLPFTVLLAGFGIAVGIGAVFLLTTQITDALNPVAEAILGLPIRSGVFLYLFLPTLLFQVTLGVNLRRMLDDWVPVMVLAVVAVIVATLAVGGALYATGVLPLTACLLIGAIVSTTDPSAVVGIFRNLAAPRRLARIIEGESLLNDAAAIALFGLFMGFVMRGVPDPQIGAALAKFPVLLGGGALVGWLAGQAGLWLMARLGRFLLAQISVSVALPYLSYVLAEQVLGASGVIAVVAAGLAVNLSAPGRLSPAAWTALREVWDLLAHWAGAFIFLLAALLIPRLLDGVRWSDLGLVAVVAGAAIAARALMLWGVLPALAALRLSPAVQPSYRVAILWGGLRGAVTLALALAVTESLRVPPDVRRMTGILATGFTLFTLMVQGPSLRPLIRWLGLEKLSPLDAALARQVVAVALQGVREEVSRRAEAYGLAREVVRPEAKEFAARLDRALAAAEEGEDIHARDRITLGLIALAGAERDRVLYLFRERAISARMAERALANSDRLIEGARSGGRLGYNRAARRSLGQGGAYGLAALLHTRARLSRPLARAAADRFESLLTQQLILTALPEFIESRIRRIHGRRVAELLRELLERRSEEIARALAGLRLQFPGYAEELERRFLRRTALRIEEREYDLLLGDGLIGPELHATLSGALDRRRGAAEERPPLDLALQKADLVAQFPLFADLPPASRRGLARAVVTRFVAPGEVLQRRDEAVTSVSFIASGAVEAERAGNKVRLGRGEMFGQLALLSRTPRRADVRALTHGVVLQLDEARFLRLLRRSSKLRRAVRDSAVKRGAPADLVATLGAPEADQDTG